MMSIAKQLYSHLQKNAFAKELLDYLISLRNYFIVASILFLSSFTAGYMNAYFNPEVGEDLLNTFTESVGWIKGETPVSIMFIIFFNNSFISLLILTTGIFLGIGSIVLITSNGYILGAIIFELIGRYGLTTMVTLVPHGIVEIPMILISGSIGLRLGSLFVLKLLKKDVKFVDEFIIAGKFYLLVILPSLFIAAVIETFISSIILFIITGQRFPI